MYSWQLKKFEESVMQDIEENKTYIRFENISLKNNKLKDIQRGDCIYIGNDMPKIFLEKNRSIYSELILYSENNYLKGIIAKLSKEYEQKRITKKSRVVIEARVSPLRFELGDSVKLPLYIFEEVYLYIDGKLFAKSSLNRAKSGYVLKIEELFYE